MSSVLVSWGLIGAFHLSCPLSKEHRNYYYSTLHSYECHAYGKVQLIMESLEIFNPIGILTIVFELHCSTVTYGRFSNDSKHHI